MKKIYRIINHSHQNAVLITKKDAQSNLWQVSLATKWKPTEDNSALPEKRYHTYDPDKTMALLGNNDPKHSEEAQAIISFLLAKNFIEYTGVGDDSSPQEQYEKDGLYQK
ncbi:hypothetical protein [Desulfotalea psychrophila]|uniref:Uncharacterized protein n=1 Tax=Desulfotalea psychrophila (strain LSv54 / DSM 12343) TaxID=177439 RepID=Q6ALM7_DESPS|nr:hypothetical protein [Desulfotalea psychrophila]CAG36748.1 unknown protein [Desulfotalea psychrophila LSv54]